MADPKKRIKVLVITQWKEEEEKVTEKKEKEKLTEEEDEEGKISDKESVCDLEKKELEEAEEAAAAAYALKGKAKMSDLVKRLIQEEKAEVKKPIEISIQELAKGLNIEVDIITRTTTDEFVTDDLIETDIWEIKVVVVEEIFFQRILHLITNVPEFVSIRFVFCSSNPKWQVLHKTSEYKKGSSAGLHIEDIPGDMSFLGDLMKKCYCVPETKDSSSHSDNYGHDDHEGEIGEQEELQVPDPPPPMKLKKRWLRDWDK